MKSITKNSAHSTLLIGYKEKYIKENESKVLPETLTDPQLVKKFPHCIEPKGTFPHSQEPATLLSQINPFNASPSHFLQIHFYIILLSMPRCYKQTLSLRSPHQNPVCTWHVNHSCYMSC
jgi:hypothetical protein